MLVKAGVDISRLSRDMRRALPFLSAWVKSMRGELTITSTYEGNHGEGSLHYANDAVDIRVPTNWESPDLEGLGKLLGVDYDVVEEGSIIHIEFDPKEGI